MKTKNCIICDNKSTYNFCGILYQMYHACDRHKNRVLRIAKRDAKVWIRLKNQEQ